MLFSLLRGQLTPQSAIAQILAVLLIIFIVLPFHEWAHAFVAYKLGDTTVKYRGRLSLNPIEHIDPIGALALLLFGYGWAKPVPIDTSNFKKPKRDMALTAIAGPAANVIAAAVGAFLLNGIFMLVPSFIASQIGIIVYIFLSYYISINLMLAVFNLIPLPPLDGSKVLFAFLSPKATMWFYRNEHIIRIVFLVLIFTGVLSYPLSFISNLLENAVLFVTSLPFRLFV